jgi:hypothetical protein
VALNIEWLWHADRRQWSFADLNLRYGLPHYSVNTEESTMLLVVTAKPSNVVGWPLASAIRVKLLGSPTAGNWSTIDGGWSALGPARPSGTWSYAKGDLRLSGGNDELMLHNVHWNFSQICVVKDLTGSGELRSSKNQLVWVMGKGLPSFELLLNAPADVREGADWICWAAALESWLGSIPGKMKLTKAQLLAKYAAATIPSGPRKGALVDFRTVMAGEGIDLTWKTTGATDSLVDAESFYEKLLSKGPLYVPYQRTSSDAVHVIVVFGVTKKANGTAAVNVMDPMAGYRTESIANFQSMFKAGVGTKKE